MAKKPELHRYSDLNSFRRLMLLIATLANYPGIGCCEGEKDDEQQGKQFHHNALSLLQQKLVILAKEVDIEISQPALPTLRKDLETLKELGILEKRMYRHGYYLGAGVMNKSEFKVAFDALESMAIYQKDATARQIYEGLKKRITGLKISSENDIFYPVRRNISRPINYTDPEKMWLRGDNQNNLFHCLQELETAILNGQTLELSRRKDLYNNANIGKEIIIPLQLIYYNIAWYLVYENAQNGHFIIGRIDRFANYIRVVSDAARTIEEQKENLKKTEKLLINGWGLNLGSLEEQRLELAGELTLEKIKVRFYPPVSNFIQEGNQRHPKQKIKLGKKDSVTNQPLYLDYSINLPLRSLNEFLFWLQGYGGCVEVIYPEHLRQRHYQQAQTLINRYGHE